jgi:hypothetical protein
VIQATHGRKGYVVDRKIPLACGGADSPSNMQWQTKADAKAKESATTAILSEVFSAIRVFELLGSYPQKTQN